jgi:hypothetical protein
MWCGVGGRHKLTMGSHVPAFVSVERQHVQTVCTDNAQRVLGFLDVLVSDHPESHSAQAHERIHVQVKSRHSAGCRANSVHTCERFGLDQ